MVALGGGHGLAATLSAVRLLTSSVTAVVTVADDGGSSGRLRRELGVVPPGDLRQALAALCDDDELGRLWRATIQHRFAAEGHLQGHTLGNLLLIALLESSDGDPVRALDTAGRLLRISGRVLPMSAVPLVIGARVRGGDGPEDVRLVRGQVAVGSGPGRVEALFLEPADPPACPEAVEAILQADLVVLGPGSWFSSVLPHLLVPGLLEALKATRARRVLALNLAPQPGETEDFAPDALVEVLAEHAPGLSWDVVLADPATVSDLTALDVASRRFGARVCLERVAATAGHPRHDPMLFADAIRGILGEDRESPSASSTSRLGRRGVPW